MRCVPQTGSKRPPLRFGARRPRRCNNLPGAFHCPRYCAIYPRYVAAFAYPAIRVHPAVLAHESPQTTVAARNQTRRLPGHRPQGRRTRQALYASVRNVPSDSKDCGAAGFRSFLWQVRVRTNETRSDHNESGYLSIVRHGGRHRWARLGTSKRHDGRRAEMSAC